MESIGSFLRKDVKLFFISELVGFLVCVSFSALFSLIFSKVPGVNFHLLSLFAVVSLALSAFSSGYVAANFKKQNGLTAGIIAGTVLFFVVLFVGKVVLVSGFTVFSLLKFVVSVIFGAVGGILAVNRK